MNLDNPGLPRINGSSATPSSPNEPDYAYMFTFLKKKIDTNAKQTDELRNENAALRSVIDELTGSNIATKKIPPIELRRVTPITPRNLFSTNILSAGDR